MGPGDTTALLVVLVAVIPGSVYTWAFERQASAYGVTLADRVLRFVAVSLAFHLLLTWPSYGVYRLVTPGGVSVGDVAVAWCWSAIVVAVPAALGSVVGGLYATRTSREGWAWVRRHLPPAREDRLLRVLLGPFPAPRAWDHLFSRRPRAYLRVQTVDGEFVGGWYGAASYAGAFPHDRDLLLEEAWRIDANGDFHRADPTYALYIAETHIATVEVVPTEHVEEVPP